jgi:hypothetical protein
MREYRNSSRARFNPQQRECAQSEMRAIKAGMVRTKGCGPVTSYRPRKEESSAGSIVRHSTPGGHS